jgi:GH24 family phage-related lysozyme (muramidase)
MADLHRVLHHLDILKCNHGGLVDLYKNVKERKVEVHQDQRVVTDKDLKEIVSIVGCSSGCKKVVSIEEGLSKEYVLTDDAIPVLSNLSATTDKGCTVTVNDTLVAELAHEEGRKNSMYVDTNGHPSIGQGFNLDKEGAREQIEALGLDYDKVYAGEQDLTDEQIDSLFADDVQTAKDDIKTYVTNFDSLSEAQQNALVNLSFNMGGSFAKKFPKFTKALNDGDFETAAKELGLASDGKSPSKWSQDVKAERAGRVIGKIRDNEPFAMPE